MKFLMDKLGLRTTRTPELNRVTVMASKGLGRVWSFSINFWLLLVVVAVLVLYLIFSFMPVMRYAGEYRQEDLLVQLEKDLQETRKALYQAKQRLKFLEDYIDPSKIPAESPKSATDSKLPPGQKGTSRSPDMETPAASNPHEPIVTIKGFNVKRRGGNISVTFKLSRSSPGRSSARGHLFVVAVDRSTDPPRLWPSSKAVFQNGVPVNYKKGQSYKIRNFRLIRAKWSFKSAEKMPSEIKILVYDRSGSLLLKKNFPLEKN